MANRANWHPRVFLLKWLLPTYIDDVFMLHIYQLEYQELMAAAERVFVYKLSRQTTFE